MATEVEKVEKVEKTEKTEKAGIKPKKAKKRAKKNVPTGIVHIQSSFNNTIVTVTDPDGNTLCWGSAGSVGFKGSRKSTPFAARLAAEQAIKAAPPFALPAHRAMNGSRFRAARRSPRFGDFGQARRPIRVVAFGHSELLRKGLPWQHGHQRRQPFGNAVRERQGRLRPAQQRVVVGYGNEFRAALLGSGGHFGQVGKRRAGGGDDEQGKARFQYGNGAMQKIG